MQPDDGTVDIQDFTIREKRIRFKVDEDRFEAFAILGLHTMQELVRVSKNIGEVTKTGDYSALTELFSKLLVPDSAMRLNRRIMSSDPDESLDVKRQVIPILHYLLEKHGVRPTQQPSD